MKVETVCCFLGKRVLALLILGSNFHPCISGSSETKPKIFRKFLFFRKNHYSCLFINFQRKPFWNREQANCYQISKHAIRQKRALSLYFWQKHGHCGNECLKVWKASFENRAPHVEHFEGFDCIARLPDFSWYYLYTKVRKNIPKVAVNYTNWL
jgi:hypothetical protein